MSLARIAAALMAASAALGLAGAARAEPHLSGGATGLAPPTGTAPGGAWFGVARGRSVRTGRGRLPREIRAARRHDFRGHFLIPGLFDTHAHVTLGPLGMAVVDGKPKVS